MLTITEIQEQIELLQLKKQEIQSYTLKDVINQKFKTSFHINVYPKIFKYKREVKRLKVCAYIDAVFEILLKKVIDDQSADIIMDYLRFCGKNNQFNRLLGGYAKFRDNLQMRQLLKFCSAVYRCKLQEDPSIRDSSNYSSLLSQMKYASSCENCGSLAFELAVQMKKINFI